MKKCTRQQKVYNVMEKDTQRFANQNCSMQLILCHVTEMMTYYSKTYVFSKKDVWQNNGNVVQNDV